MSKFGDFYGRYRINESESLVCSTDGVGTKSVLLKRLMGKKGLEVCGHDLVSHCVNDILVSGADPMLFLDYFASSKLDAQCLGKCLILEWNGAPHVRQQCLTGKSLVEQVMAFFLPKAVASSWADSPGAVAIRRSGVDPGIVIVPRLFHWQI